MGGSSTPNGQKTSDVLRAYTQYLPGLISSTSAQQPLVAENQLNATMATQPLYNALNLQQAQQYGLPLAQVGQEIQNSNSLAGAKTNLEMLQGSGGQAAHAADALSRSINPNYYSTMDNSARQANNLLNSINLGGLSPGEQNAVERSLNQSNVATNNLGLDNATNAVSNAMNFGGAYNQKLGILGNALGAANQTANTAQNTGFNPVNVALGQPQQSNSFGSGTFSPTNTQTQAGSAGNAFSFGSGMMGNMVGSNNAMINAQASQANANSIPAYIGSVCCFIFLEAYHGKMPWSVRRGRDVYYKLNPDIATGYRRMASWLVPMMKRSAFVRAIVWAIMIKPITHHLVSVTYRQPVLRGNKRITRFWLRVWALLGRGHTEQEFCKPWMYPMLRLTQ